MSGFREMVEQVQGFFRETMEADDYLFAGERCEEAALVEPCVDRFVYGEMDPTRRLTASRTSLPGSPPSLAEKLGSKFDQASPQEVDGLRNAVTKPVATGYLCLCETEPRGGVTLAPERDAAAIWDFWGPSCRDQLETVGVPASWAKMVRKMGADSLITDLKDLGFTRWLGGSKLNQLGLLYGQAGVLLRVAQTSNISNEHFDTVVATVRGDPERAWPFDAYPT